MNTILELKQINKSFGHHHVLTDINLSVEKGEFITLLGPSGCGKTTLLRIIAGLENPESGSVFLSGTDVTALAPNKRNVNTVFQNYALFPHMNIEANIGYGLKIKGAKKPEIKEKVSQMLRLVKLEGEEKKMPSQLSGGQRQRVAIARAAVNNPDVLLLDEPLGALDLQLRRYLQNELKQLQRELNITFIYITHDQEEAMNMSDRIFVMHNGMFEQSGTPSQIYDRPSTAFAASFVGTANLLRGQLLSFDGDMAYIDFLGHKIKASCPYGVFDNKAAAVCVRSENIIMQDTPGDCAIAATVIDHTYTNGILRVKLKVSSPDKKDTVQIIASRQGIRKNPKNGDTVYCTFDPQNAVVVEDNADEE